MSLSIRRAFVLLGSASLAGAIALAANGCGSDATTAGTGTGADAATDSASEREAAAPPVEAGAFDASCPQAKTLPDKGETCIGFGKGTPCDPACGLGEFGYVCFNGGPPGFTGCLQASSTGGLGDTYCCPQNKCVPQPDQDAKCVTAGKTHRYQCPPDPSGTAVAPPAGCADAGSGGSAVEQYFCCP